MSVNADDGFQERPLTAAEAGAVGFMPLAAPRRPLIESHDFRNAMAAHAATVTVVTAAEGEDRAGRTATAVFSLSATPPSILVSIDSDSLLAGIMRRRGSFSLAMLERSQWTIANAFAGRTMPEHRFKVGQWETWASGNPKLQGPVVAMDCDVIGIIETAGHLLFAGGIVAVETVTGRTPLVWHDRGYAAPAGREK